MNKKKRYTVYKFPSLYGTPKSFKYKITAWLYAIMAEQMCELEDNKTGRYYPYWV